MEQTLIDRNTIMIPPENICHILSPLIEKVESCRFLCPSSLGPFVDGVTTADSGKVGLFNGDVIEVGTNLFPTEEILDNDGFIGDSPVVKDEALAALRAFFSADFCLINRTGKHCNDFTSSRILSWFNNNSLLKASANCSRFVFSLNLFCSSVRISDFIDDLLAIGSFNLPITSSMVIGSISITLASLKPSSSSSPYESFSRSSLAIGASAIGRLHMLVETGMLERVVLMLTNSM
ncbi:hypothetical protein ALC62_00720 [Cyphomyrmex costatus]|uniref:Uncharacterized protein n=1 Tax=Cyphomyrmex costatus TaxID=456900 RepID=A0A151IQ92_9HYME|nr:hypothetical protein ALC62_00720 [Cyphomyrmex costatus]